MELGIAAALFFRLGCDTLRRRPAAATGAALRMNGTIRAASSADAGAIATCGVETWRAAYEGSMPRAVLDGLDPVAKAGPWRERLEHPPERWATWILEVGGEFAGYCAVGPVRDLDLDLDPGRVGELQVLNLRPAFWGRGFGRQLLEHAFGVLRRLSFMEVTLWCLEGNRRAVRFYAAAGFQQDGPPVSKSVGGHELVHVRLRRPLEEPGRDSSK